MSDAHSRESWGVARLFCWVRLSHPPPPSLPSDAAAPMPSLRPPTPPNLASAQHNSWRSGTSRPPTIFMWPSASWTGLAGLSRPEESHSRW